MRRAIVEITAHLKDKEDSMVLLTSYEISFKALEHRVYKIFTTKLPGLINF